MLADGIISDGSMEILQYYLDAWSLKCRTGDKDQVRNVKTVVTRKKAITDGKVRFRGRPS